MFEKPQVPQDSGRPFPFCGLAVLTAMTIPVVSAVPLGKGVIAMAWAFGIMGNVPSVYVLANKPVPSMVDDGAEGTLWKIARGWGLTFGPVFAVVLVVLLRTGVPRQKRMAFVALVFAMSLAVMLLLNNVLRDETWSVLDMLALSISFCGVTAFIVTSEPRGRIARGGDPGLEGGGSRHLQPNVTVNQAVNPPHIPRAELEADGNLEVVQSSIPSDEQLVIGDGDSRA